MGWLIALGIVAVLAVIPLGASVKYDWEGPVVWILAGPIRFQIFPGKQKKKEQEPKPKTAPKSAGTTNPTREQDPAGGSWKDFLPLVRLGLDFLGDLRRKLRVNCLKLHLTMAADDPCDLAVNYGRANAAMAALLAQLNRLFVIKKQDVRINCDFTAEESRIIARLDLTITLGRLLCLGMRYGFRGLKTYFSIKKQQEGGANL